MRNDLYIGALVAIGAHAALVLIPNSRRIPVATPPETVELICGLHVPKPPEEEPEPLPASPDDAPKGRPDAVAPPSQPEAPRPVTTGDIVQTIPPVVEGPTNRSINVIPTERPGRPDGHRGNIVDLRALDRAPMARFQARPDYPFEMRRNGIAGEVLVEFIVTAEGAVRDAHAVRSSQREFEDAAVRAVSKWTFRAGQKDGRNVSTRMLVPVVFSLNDDRG